MSFSRFRHSSSVRKPVGVEESDTDEDEQEELRPSSRRTVGKSIQVQHENTEAKPAIDSVSKTLNISFGEESNEITSNNYFVKKKVSAASSVSFRAPEGKLEKSEDSSTDWRRLYVDVKELELEQKSEEVVIDDEISKEIIEDEYISLENTHTEIKLAKAIQKNKEIRPVDIPSDEEMNEIELSAIKRGAFTKMDPSNPSDLNVDFDAFRKSRAHHDVEKLSRVPDSLSNFAPLTKEVVSQRALLAEQSLRSQRQELQRSLKDIEHQIKDTEEKLTSLQLQHSEAAKEEAFFAQLSTWSQEYIKALHQNAEEIERLEQAYHSFLAERNIYFRSRLRNSLQEKSDMYKECLLTNSPLPFEVLTEPRQHLASDYLELMKSFRIMSYDHLLSFFLQWKDAYLKTYQESFAEETIPLVFEWRVRADMITWEPFETDTFHPDWMVLLMEAFNSKSIVDSLVDKIVLPKLVGMFQHVLNVFDDKKEVPNSVSLLGVLKNFAHRDRYQMLLDSLETNIQSASNELLTDQQNEYVDIYASAYFAMKLVDSICMLRKFLDMMKSTEVGVLLLKNVVVTSLQEMITVDKVSSLVLLRRAYHAVQFSDLWKTEIIPILLPLIHRLLEELFVCEEIEGAIEDIRLFILNVIVPLELYDEASRLSKKYRIK